MITLSLTKKTRSHSYLSFVVSQRLLMAAGQDLEPYWDVYRQHLRGHVVDWIEKYRVGNISAEEAAANKKVPFGGTSHQKTTNAATTTTLELRASKREVVSRSEPSNYIAFRTLNPFLICFLSLVYPQTCLKLTPSVIRICCRALPSHLLENPRLNS